MEGEALGLEMGLRRHYEREIGKGGGNAKEIPREDEFGTLLVRCKADKVHMIRLDGMRSNREAEIAERDDDTQ